MVGGAVVADHPGTVDGQGHRQVGDADVVDDLVEGALEEGRVDGHHRSQALHRQPGGEGHRMLLGDADIEEAVRIRPGEATQPGSGDHGGGDGDDAAVALRQAYQGVAENLGVGGRLRRTIGLAAGHVEGTDAMEDVGVALRRAVAFALLGEDMDQHRPLRVVAHRLQGFDEIFKVVTVDGADIVELEGLEEHPRGEEALEALLALAEDVEDVLADIGDLQFFHQVRLDAAHGLAGELAAEEAGERANIRRNRHLVVVQDDDQVFVEVAGVVERLEGQAGGHRPVADDGDGAAVILLEGLGEGDAQGGGDRGRAVAGLEGVVGAFLEFGKAAQPLVLAQGGESLPAAGDDLVGIALVADIPDELVMRGVEDEVQGERQLDHTEAGGEVAAVAGDGGDDELADLRRQPVELGDVQFANILW